MLALQRAARVLVAGALAVAVAGLAQPSPAHADALATAQARLDALQQLARDTTTKLSDGTRRWEADQGRLHRMQTDLGNTRRHIAQTQAALDAKQKQVDAIVRGLYMRPTSAGLQLALTRGPDEVLPALQAQQGLDVASGSQSQIIARAVTARHRLKNQERTAQQLVSEAAALTAASARRLSELNALADRTAAQLGAAQDALSKALAERAARAAAAKAARERAARSRVVFSGAATCSGTSTSGQANGNLDPSSLCPLWMAPGHRLRSDAAAAFNKLSQFHAASVGNPLCVTDSYRSYSEQVSVYHRKPGLAAVPGSSEHGWGKAVDFCGGVETFGSAAYGWMKANAGRFGFFHPDWAEPAGSKPEAWHWEFSG
jgi:peptidoglycan hydrolase CwlO-like protein